MTDHPPTGQQQTPAPAADGSEISPEAVARLAEAFFGETVIKITAPGGRTRDSVRVHFSDWTAIASRRRTEDRLNREAAFLSALADTDAPVPRLLGVVESVLFQSDLGSTRLAAELGRRTGQNREDLITSVYESLWEIKTAVAASSLRTQIKPIATGEAFLQQFVFQTRHIAAAFHVKPPKYDPAAVVSQLRLPALSFVKWDARPGNASIGPDGRVFWFDWEDYGTRSGTEDFAFLMADEFWHVDAETSLRLFATDGRATPEAQAQLARFATFVAIQRLRYIRGQWAKYGWVSHDHAQRYDRIGGVEALIAPLCERAAAFADLSPVTRPLAGWVRDLADPAHWPPPSEAD